MNSKRRLKRYIGPGYYKIVAWILGLASLGLMLFGLIAGIYIDDEENAKPFALSLELKSGAYMDVVRVSEPAHTILVRSGEKTKNNYYCFALDKTGGRYIIRVDDEDMETLYTQRKQWDSNSGSESVRIYGTIVEYPSGHRQHIIDSEQNVDAKGNEAFPEIYGSRYLFANATPSSQKGFHYMIIGGFLLFVLWIGFAIGNMVIKGYTRRSLARLEAIGMIDRAAQELDNPLAIYGKGRCRISENFVYAGRYGAALYLGDVIWVYKQEAEFSDGTGNSFLKARICTGQKFTIIFFNGSNGADERELIMTKLCERNPYILTGDSKENLNKYKETVRVYQTTRRRPFETGQNSSAGE